MRRVFARTCITCCSRNHDGIATGARRPQRKVKIRLAVVVYVLVVVGCRGKRRNAVVFDTTSVSIITQRDTVRFTVEEALTREQRAQGLMDRDSLAAGRGMLFVFPGIRPATSSFWMHRTRMPLDIAFIDSAGFVRSIKAMVPCTSRLASDCHTYAGDARFRAALEANVGFFTRHGVRVGDRLLSLPSLSFAADTGVRARVRPE